MAHEIEMHDGLVLNQNAAWHGLGTIVENAPTLAEALKIAKLDWTVESWPVSACSPEGDKRLILPKHRANIRADIGTCLGVVGKDYQPIQNSDLAEFCEMLAKEGDTVKLESAGSIRNGAKVWFLMKGESFSVRGAGAATSKDDAVSPYILVSNGHDGGTALRCTPTTVRVVCSNTLHAVIPQFDAESKKMSGKRTACYYARHTKNVKERVEEARTALGLYCDSIAKTREVIDSVAAKTMTAEQVKQFFLTCYTRDFGSLDPHSFEKADQRRMVAARDAFRYMDEHFSRGLDLTGSTAWGAMNAYTEWLEHDRPIRVTNYGENMQQRLSAKLFGVDADRAHLTLLAALAV